MAFAVLNFDAFEGGKQGYISKLELAAEGVRNRLINGPEPEELGNLEGIRITETMWYDNMKRRLDDIETAIRRAKYIRGY